MPLNKINYKNIVIYKIQHIDNEEMLYVGHTTDFTKRKYQHKFSCNTDTDKSFNLKLYQMIRENGGWEMFNMVEVNKFPCNDRNEAAAEEDRVIRMLKANMNSRYSILDKQHKHELANSKVECECGNHYTRKHKTRHEKSQRHKDLLAQ